MRERYVGLRRFEKLYRKTANGELISPGLRGFVLNPPTKRHRRLELRRQAQCVHRNSRLVKLNQFCGRCQVSFKSDANHRRRDLRKKQHTVLDSRTYDPTSMLPGSPSRSYDPTRIFG